MWLAIKGSVLWQWQEETFIAIHSTYSVFSSKLHQENINIFKDALFEYLNQCIYMYFLITHWCLPCVHCNSFSPHTYIRMLEQLEPFLHLRANYLEPFHCFIHAVWQFKDSLKVLSTCKTVKCMKKLVSLR